MSAKFLHRIKGRVKVGQQEVHWTHQSLKVVNLDFQQAMADESSLRCLVASQDWISKVGRFCKE